MTATYTPATLPVTVTILSRWINWSDSTRPQFKFMLSLACDGRSMEVPFSGGILAFGARDNAFTKRELAQESVSRGKTKGPLGHVLAGNRLHDKELEKGILGNLLNRATVDAASVCYSLVSDTQAGSETFADFCSSFGYDEDSRKAFTIYEACQKGGAEFRKLVGSDFDAIAEALQDY